MPALLGTRLGLAFSEGRLCQISDVFFFLISVLFSQFKDFIELLNLVELAYETDRYYLMPLNAILVKIVTDQLIV